MPNKDFKANIIGKVGFKIQNSGIILKTFTHVILWIMILYGKSVKENASFQGYNVSLSLKAPIKTAADNKFCNILPNFRKKKRNDIS